MCFVSVMSHCQSRFSEVILGDEAHIFRYEVAGIAQVSSFKTVSKLIDKCQFLSFMLALAQAEKDEGLKSR